MTVAPPRSIPMPDQEANRVRLYALAIAVLIGVRFLAAIWLPLYFGDEPYYWVWSRNLAWGYYDHPPAVAFLIRAGTTLFGDTEFGARFFGIALSIPTTMCVWRTGTLLLGGTENGARAALFFNLTLMMHVQTVLVTPDASVLPCSAALLWAVAEAEARKDGRWWLAAGLFAGLGLLSKYTIVLVGAGVLAWLLLTASGRNWLASRWPWLGGALALLVFLPNLIWSASHDWGAIAFQSGRLGYSGRFRWYYLPQFIGEQFLLATPFIMILALIGLARATRSAEPRKLMIATQLWPTIVFFIGYAFVDRVHRNWPDVVYPALVIAAADAYRMGAATRFTRAAAIPCAVAILVLVYAQMLFKLVSFAPHDRLDHHLASTMRERAAPLADAVSKTGARGILTTDFPVTSWLKYYLRPQVPIIMVHQEFRFPAAPRASADQLQGTLLYIAVKDDLLWVVRNRFAEVELIAEAPFLVYRVSGFKGEPYGRLP
ncbi:MAG: glycosyltransferase family 39 protein [Hyphomicrobiales bacterium]|nr:glycosyltransferase family 39 protein [Hyphomicrobiales bacterium]